MKLRRLCTVKNKDSDLHNMLFQYICSSYVRCLFWRKDHSSSLKALYFTDAYTWYNSISKLCQLWVFFDSALLKIKILGWVSQGFGVSEEYFIFLMLSLRTSISWPQCFNFVWFFFREFPSTLEIYRGFTVKKGDLQFFYSSHSWGLFCLL